jgi:Ca2+/Na+ antiporter
VAIGSNVFNLAALLGLSAVVAGRIALHRRVVLLEGTIALVLAAAAVAVVSGGLPVAGGLAIALGVLVPYGAVLGIPRRRLGRLGLPSAWVTWLAKAIHEEEIELQEAVHPKSGELRDAVVAGLTLLVVVSASVVMERAASTLGTRHAIPQIVIGGLVLAAVTSLPNAMAALYLARRGRGAATLSTALNSNALNVVIGLMLSGTILGLGSPSGQAVLVAGWYLGLTALALALAYRTSGLGRRQGILVVLSYLLFVGVLVAVA